MLSSLQLLTLSGLDFVQPGHHEEALPQFARFDFIRVFIVLMTLED